MKGAIYTLAAVLALFLVLFLIPAIIHVAQFSHGKTLNFRIHDCPSAMQYGDELDVDFWC